MPPGFKKILLRLLLLLTVLGMLALGTRHYWFQDHDWDSEQLAGLASVVVLAVLAIYKRTRPRCRVTFHHLMGDLASQ